MFALSESDIAKLILHLLSLGVNKALAMPTIAKVHVAVKTRSVNKPHVQYADIARVMLEIYTNASD